MDDNVDGTSVVDPTLEYVTGIKVVSDAYVIEP